jgi:hypothetical protein
MFSATKYRFTVVVPVALGLFLWARPAQAQTGGRGYMSSLQQQNALNQQQNAVQTALQQTTALLQVGRQAGPAPYPIYFLKQQSALDVALQQTIALKQVTQGQNNTLHQLSVQQQFALQNVQQQAMGLQNSLSVQRTPLTPSQRQTLLQEQNSLFSLLNAAPLSVPRSTRK